MSERINYIFHPKTLIFTNSVWVYEDIFLLSRDKHAISGLNLLLWGKARWFDLLRQLSVYVTVLL